MGMGLYFRKVISILGFLGICLLLPGVAISNPQGGIVAAGAASIASTGNVTNITQSTNKAVINWQTFNIAPNEATHFMQPSTSSITLNRVNPYNGSSQIFGQLTANGNIWIINPAGILFGKGAQVNVGGILATTADISDRDFMRGNYQFRQNPQWNGAVINQGTITARDGGLVALVAPGVENSGIIQAKRGRVILGAGNTYTVDLYGDGLINFGVDANITKRAKDSNSNELRNAVTNSGKIIANGGTVVMTVRAAKNVVEHSINMSGIVEAKSVYQRGGVIVLDGGNHSSVKITGTINASGRKFAQNGGLVKISGRKIILAENARIDASGYKGGGKIYIGGGKQGKDSSIKNAKNTYIGSNVQLLADATTYGNGGEIIVWADNSTQFNGTASARGGTLGGNGGFVETSGKENLSVGATAFVDTRAPYGKTGKWLLDPKNITIATAGGSAYSAGVNNLFSNNPTGNVTITPASLNSAATDIILQANNDITFTNAVNLTTAGKSLTAQAGRSININANITTNNGAINLTAGENAAAGVVDAQRDPGNAAITMSSGSTLTSGGGDIILTINPNTGVTNAASGNITIQGLNAGTGNVLIQNLGASTGSSIVRASGTELITANSVALNANPAVGTASGIGTLAAPIRVNTANLTANAQSDGIFLAPTSAINIGDAVLGSLTGISTTGDLSIAASGSINQIQRISTAGTATFSVGGNDLTLNNTSNSFTGTVNITNTGNNNISLVNNGNLSLGTISMGNSAGTLTIDTSASNGAISQNGATIITSGNGAITFNAGNADITLDNANNFRGTVSLNNSGAHNASVTKGATGTLTLGNSTVGQNFTANAIDAITVAGTINSGSGTVTINTNTNGAGNNSFTMSSGSSITTNNQAVNINVNTAAGGGGSATIRDITTNGGTISVATDNDGNTSGGSITQSSGTSLNTSGGSGGINLSSPGAITLNNSLFTDTGTVMIQANTDGSGGQNFAMNSGSSITTNNAAVNINVNTATGGSGNATIRDITTNGGAISVATNTGGNTTGGTLTQSSGTLSSNGGIITLGSANTITINSTIDSGTGSVQIAANTDGAGGQDFRMNSGSSITTNNAPITINVNSAAGGTGNASLRDISTNGGTLTVATNTGGNTTGSTISQGGTTTLNIGSGNFSTGNGDIILTNNNDFNGTVLLNTSGIANDVNITDANMLTLGTSNIGGDLTINAPTGITLVGDVNSGGNQNYNYVVTLGNNINLMGSTINFASTIDGTQMLTINGDAVFGGDIGSLTPLESLTITGSSNLAGNVNTNGEQSYQGAVILNAPSITLTATDGDMSFGSTITGTGGGSILNLMGGNAIDKSLSAGSNDMTWTITGTNRGTITGTDINNATVTFDGFGNLIGGNNKDTFVFQNIGSLTGSIDGAIGGINTLDYSRVINPVTINLANNTASQIDGTFSNINNLIGGSNNNNLIGPNTDVTWNFTGTNTGTVAGIDFTNFENINTGNGNNTLTGTANLASLQTGYAGSTILNTNSITTSGIQMYNNPVTLTADNSLAASDINFNSTLNGSHNLNLDTSNTGNIVFNSNVGNLQRLNQLTILNTNNLTNNGLIKVNLFNQLAGTGLTSLGSSGLDVLGSSNFTTNNVTGAIYTGALSLDTQLANLVGSVAGLTGQAGADQIIVVNTISTGTHFFDGIDLAATPAPPTPPNPPSPTPIVINFNQGILYPYEQMNEWQKYPEKVDHSLGYILKIKDFSIKPKIASQIGSTIKIEDIL